MYFFKKNSLLLIFCVLTSLCLSAQDSLHIDSVFVLKFPKVEIGVGLWIPKSDALGFEAYFTHFLSKKMGLTLGFGYMDKTDNSGLRAGSFLQDVYQEKEIIRAELYPSIVFSQSQWESVGQNEFWQPIERLHPVSVYRLSLGINFLNRRAKSVWNWELRPALFAYQLNYLEINQSSEVKADFRNTEDAGRRSFYEVVRDTRTIHYQQTRTIESKSALLFGVGYAVGVRRIYRGHYFLGARLLGTVTTGQPYKDGLPSALAPYAYHATVEVGTWF